MQSRAEAYRTPLQGLASWLEAAEDEMADKKKTWVEQLDDESDKYVNTEKQNICVQWGWVTHDMVRYAIHDLR